MSSRRWWIGAAVLLAAAAPPASAEQGSGAITDLQLDRSRQPERVEGIGGVEQNLFRDGRVYIGGQPSQAALAALRELGITAVVNLRTPPEMDDRQRVPYDEAAAVADLGMEYIAIPLGGAEHPYTPQAVDRLAKALADHPGPVLVHCTIGWRASYLWVAYLIREQGFALPDALARGEAIAITPDPLEGLLGRTLTVRFADEARPGGAPQSSDSPR
ncbi:MAG: hypothetical protein C3F15_09915 [Holophagae bacterium]|nr:MAG: hypothetical protein C3F15_09915 [Holophagae bacterium]